MATTADALQRAETRLHTLTRRTEQAIIDRWRAAHGNLDRVPATRPDDLRAWLRQEPRSGVEEVLGSLVTLAQRGDTVALLAVVVCLAPGIRALARQTHVTADEAMSEVTLGILEYPVARRRSVAGGLLLDARNRITRAARRTPRPVDLHGDSGHGEHATVTAGGAPEGPTTAERILALVIQARRNDLLTRDDAQLIVDTRLSGRRMAPAAARLGMSTGTGYQRRTRAERRMALLARTDPE